MDPTTDTIAALTPPLAVGERISLRVQDAAGRREVIGFVTALSDAACSVVDRRGTTHDLPRHTIDAARRVAVSLGRNPVATPRDLLDALAARAAADGTPWVARISTLLDGRTPPATVPSWGTHAELHGVRARFEGEWVTLPDGDEAIWVAAAWWATRMGARSIQVRTTNPQTEAELKASGFVQRT